MKNSGRNNLFLTAAFAASMGILEAIVAYYLRLLYYPMGFSFPLVVMPDAVLRAEIVREAATMAMLVTVALLSGKDKTGKFILFLYMFGIWDILYYLGLKVLVGWPDSLLTWDLLFLIPLPWAAPVLAPVICSLFFIIAGVAVTSLQEKGLIVKFRTKEWILMISGMLLILYTYIIDFTRVIYSSVSKVTGSDTTAKSLIEHYIPEEYRWGVFILGAAMLFVSLFMAIKRLSGHRRG